MKIDNCDRRVLFIHVPKCGGCSVIKTLNYIDRLGSHHVITPLQPKNSKIHTTVHEYDLNQYDYVFTFIRNPWARAVSFFFWNKIMFREYTVDQLNRKINESYISDHLTHILNKENQQANKFKSFTEWVSSGMVGFYNQQIFKYINSAVKVFKIEDKDSWKNLLYDLDIKKTKCNMLHENKSEHENYRMYYNNRTKLLVNYMFKKDINMFKYEF